MSNKTEGSDYVLSWPFCWFHVLYIKSFCDELVLNGILDLSYQGNCPAYVLSPAKPAARPPNPALRISRWLPNTGREPCVNRRTGHPWFIYLTNPLNTHSFWIKLSFPRTEHHGRNIPFGLRSSEEQAKVLPLTNQCTQGKLLNLPRIFACCLKRFGPWVTLYLPATSIICQMAISLGHWWICSRVLFPDMEQALSAARIHLVVGIYKLHINTL